VNRREFLSRTLASAIALPFARPSCLPGGLALRASLPDPTIGWHGQSAFSMAPRAVLEGAGAAAERQRVSPEPATDYARIGADLRGRFADLRRHFVFEYYAWYGTNPWRHWEQWERHPPADLASNYVPVLGAYDSRDAAVIEQHAEWIAKSGAGAINISWWGRGSFEDRAVPLIMDVMRDHDIRVTFHLEPYRTDRVRRYADDILYLLREYGEKRKWDAFLLLEDASGHAAPVIKSFRTIVPRQGTDCHGTVFTVPDWVPDTQWRQQTDRVRETLRNEFETVTLLADVSDVGRMQAAGFDGMAIYDNYVRPDTWRPLADACSSRDQVFSFNTNPGFDGIHLRTVDPGSCYVPTSVEPSGSYDWASARERDRAAHESQARIADSFATTLRLQTDAALANVRHGFFLVYINSFNEWHEGHQFEPMLDARSVPDEARGIGYHDPSDGAYRLEKIGELLDLVLD